MKASLCTVHPEEIKQHHCHQLTLPRLLTTPVRHNMLPHCQLPKHMRSQLQSARTNRLDKLIKDIPSSKPVPCMPFIPAQSNALAVRLQLAKRTQKGTKEAERHGLVMENPSQTRGGKGLLITWLHGRSQVSCQRTCLVSVLHLRDVLADANGTQDDIITWDIDLEQNVAMRFQHGCTDCVGCPRKRKNNKQKTGQGMH